MAAAYAVRGSPRRRVAARSGRPRCAKDGAPVLELVDGAGASSRISSRSWSPRSSGALDRVVRRASRDRLRGMPSAALIPPSAAPNHCAPDGSSRAARRRRRDRGPDGSPHARQAGPDDQRVMRRIHATRPSYIGLPCGVGTSSRVTTDAIESGGSEVRYRSGKPEKLRRRLTALEPATDTMAAFDLGPKTCAEPTPRTGARLRTAPRVPGRCRTTDRAQLHEDLAERIAVLDLSRGVFNRVRHSSLALRREQRFQQGPIAAVVLDVSPSPVQCRRPAPCRRTDDLSQDAREPAEWNPESGDSGEPSPTRIPWMTFFPAAGPVRWPVPSTLQGSVPVANMLSACRRRPR